MSGSVYHCLRLELHDVIRHFLCIRVWRNYGGKKSQSGRLANPVPQNGLKR
jgi:hypothetical protein